MRLITTEGDGLQVANFGRVSGGVERSLQLLVVPLPGRELEMVTVEDPEKIGVVGEEIQRSHAGSLLKLTLSATGVLAGRTLGFVNVVSGESRLRLPVQYELLNGISVTPGHHVSLGLMSPGVEAQVCKVMRLQNLPFRVEIRRVSVYVGDKKVPGDCLFLLPLQDAGYRLRIKIPEDLTGRVFGRADLDLSVTDRDGHISVSFVGIVEP